MTSLQFIINDIVEILISVAGVVIAWRWWNRVGTRSVIVFYALRYLVMVLAMSFVEGFGSVDLAGWYMHAEWMVDQGLMPQRDFHSPYHLGFNALLSLSVWLWHSPYAIVLAFTLAELLAIWYLYPVLAHVGSVRSAKRTIILFMTSPVAIHAARSTQDEPLLLLGVSTIVWALVRNRTALAVAAATLTFASTKVFSLLYFAAFAGWRKWRGVATVLAIVVSYWTLGWALGVHPLDCSFGREIGMDAVADQPVADVTRGNLWTLFEGVPVLARYAVLLTALGIAGLVFRQVLFDDTDSRSQLVAAMRLTAVWYLLFNGLSPMSFFMYMVPALPFILFLLLEDGSWSGRGMLAAFLVWSVAFAFKDVQSSFIDRMGIVFDLTQVFGSLAFAGWLWFPALPRRMEKEVVT